MPILRRDCLYHQSRIARGILIVGALIHFAVCWPLYHRRGFPEVDPLLLAMVWMWAPPIVISAIFVRFSHQRIKDLIVYALATGFVVSWSTVDMVPNHKTWLAALAELIFFGPLMILCVLILEFATQLLLERARCFVPTGMCESCGYWLKMLTTARCPECGTPFGEELLDSTYSPHTTPRLRRWTNLLITLLLAASVAFPFIYRQWTFAASAEGGRTRAEADWSNGQAIWFVPQEEIAAMSPTQQSRFWEMESHTDPATNLQIQEIWGDWQHHLWQTAYRRVIERKLQEAGKSPPDF